MLLNHVGIINNDEEKAVLFYRDFLGLLKTGEFVVEPELSEQLFSISKAIKVLVFEKENTKIEVFISLEFSQPSPNMFHIGLGVDNLAGLIEEASKRSIQVISGSHKGKTVYFVKDFSGNLIEVKQKR